MCEYGFTLCDSCWYRVTATVEDKPWGCYLAVEELRHSLNRPAAAAAASSAAAACTVYTAQL
jgi:hypothetical protein